MDCSECTEAELALLGQEVVLLSDQVHDWFIVRAGALGIVENFGSISGDPYVSFKGGSSELYVSCPIGAVKLKQNEDG